MKPGDVNITYANIDRGKKILNYQPQVPLHIGIENFVNWYRKLYLEAGDL
jgi:nucleoside-diphosphate-sugar epimerase